ncbi:MAG: beta-ketoacyl-[acyl-carrier-protein] synthase family protein [Deltaproteobacteria bacterium]
MAKQTRRVVVTGLSLLTPLGAGVENVWGRLCAGQSGIGDLSKLDRSRYRRTRAAEVREFDSVESRDESLQPHGQAVAYAVAAARSALHDARLGGGAQRSRMGVAIGTTMGASDIVERIIDAHGLRAEEAPGEAASAQLEYFANGHLSGEVARRFELGGPVLTFPTACAAGNYALATGALLISAGRADMMLAGGADPFTRTCYTIFYRLGASTSGQCRPFSADREGMVVGEGAAMLVLEELEHAKARGATIYAELTGHGLACDAHHRTGPHPEGRGAIQAMHAALARAQLQPSDISYISAHGTGTPANDWSEARAMIGVFGEQLSRVPVSSIKSMIGHCMGAASAIEAAVCCLAVRDGVAPPTATSDVSDPKFGLPLDIIPRQRRQLAVEHAMSNAFAFGGCVSSLILSKYREA